MDGTLSFERRLPSESAGERLHRLALVLRAIEYERQGVVGAPGLLPAERVRRLTRLEREAFRAGLGEFHGLLDRLCREFCRRSPVGSHPRFDSELLSEEVKLMVHARLPQFDPTRGHFGPWLKVYVLLPVYKRLCTEMDVDWGRRQPQTQGGRFRRWLNRLTSSPLSLDAPLGVYRHDGEPPVLGETVADTGGPEVQLIEEQCRERFLRALEELGEGERVLLERVHLRGEQQKEVARSVGLTPGRVSQKLKHAAGKLAGALGKSFEGECGETAFCQGLLDHEDRPTTVSGEIPGTAAQAAFERALPELVRRSQWRGTKFAPAGPIGGSEGELLDELLARPAQARSEPPGSGALRLASLATGAVAAGWVLIVLAPPRLPPVIGPPIAQGPEPVPTSTPTLQIARPMPAGTSGKQTGGRDPRKTEGRGGSRSARAGQGDLRKGEGNGGPASSGTSPSGAVTSENQLAGSRGTGYGTEAGDDRASHSPQPIRDAKIPPNGDHDLYAAAGAVGPQRPVEPDGGPPEEGRNSFDPRSSRSGAEGLCAALSALAPVPLGLEGFALVEVALGVDGALAEGEGLPRTLVSGGKQVDGFVSRSLRELAAGGRVGSNGRYRVALEAERRLWSCKEAEGLRESAP